MKLKIIETTNKFGLIYENRMYVVKLDPNKYHYDIMILLECVTLQ